MLGRIGCVAACAVAVISALSPSAARAEDPGLLRGAAGIYDFDHTDMAGEFRGEYLFGHGISFVKPVVGALVTTEGSLYTYGGLALDLVFADHYVVMPTAAVGYFVRGNGKNLGYPLEFKTGAEFAYRFDGASRVGLTFDHISNAGLGKHNPGTEQLLVTYSLPIQGGL